jgi:exodeoxyribonuclease VII large subunit
MDDGRKIYTVSELNREIKVVLEDAYPEIWLEGEISNCRMYSSGHLYFSLKDAEAQISAVMFQGMARYLRFKLEDGLKVLARGRVSSYPKRGEYQIIVQYVEPAGRGALQMQFEQLKAKLEKEGLLAAERKRPLPFLPQKIGVVTSPVGAAIRDILSVIDRRFANVEILLYPVKVQGDEAKYEIADAIQYLNRHYPSLDVLLVGRGGGSYEDLWAFNEEAVARAIAESKIPVISCVGHEIDFTIADFVADLRAATPSAAAELVVRNKEELIERLRNLRLHLTDRIQFAVTRYAERIDRLSRSRALRNPVELYEERIQLIKNYRQQLATRLQFMILHAEENIRHLVRSRAISRPSEIFEDRTREIDELQEQLNAKVGLVRENKKNRTALLAEKLNLLSPLNILGRGYAICRKMPSNEIVRDAQQLAADERVTVKLRTGGFQARVEKAE